MKKILFTTLLLISTKALSTPNVATQVQELGAIYTEIINSKLDLEDKHRNQQCRLQIELYDAGLDMKVKGVSIIDGFPSAQSSLCRNAFKTIANLDSLPKSEAEEVNQQLKKINLTIIPE